MKTKKNKSPEQPARPVENAAASQPPLNNIALSAIRGITTQFCSEMESGLALIVGAPGKYIQRIVCNSPAEIDAITSGRAIRIVWVPAIAMTFPPPTPFPAPFRIPEPPRIMFREETCWGKPNTKLGGVMRGDIRSFNANEPSPIAGVVRGRVHSTDTGNKHATGQVAVIDFLSDLFGSPEGGKDRRGGAGDNS